MHLLGYSEESINEGLATQEKLIETFKNLLFNEYGDLFEPIDYKSLPDCESAEYQEIYEPNPMIEELAIAIRMITDE